MRLSRPALVVLALFSITLSVTAQQPPFPTQKDAQAVTLLQQMVASGRWTSAIQDVAALGTVTFADGTLGTVALKARGPTQASFVLAVGGKSRNTIVNGSLWSLSTGGVTRYGPARTVSKLQFPFFTDLALPDEPEVAVEYLGTENIGQTAYKVRIHREPRVQQAGSDEIRVGSVITVWLSANTHLPLQCEYQVGTLTNRMAFITRKRTFSDYRDAGGVLLPFRQQDWLEQQPLYTFQLESVTINNGFTDADFAIRTPAQVAKP